MRKVIYLGSPEGLEATSRVLSSVAEVQSVAPETAHVAAALATADALLDASMKTRITAGMIGAASKLRIVSCATTGADHIDRDALAARNIPLRTLKEDPQLLRNITPAAELSWALLMACARRLKGALAHVEQGSWVREQFPGIMLNGRVLGLVGCGRIGGWMARYAQAFGMRVLAHDPYQSVLPDGVAARPLQDLLQEADFVSVHVHLSDETRGLLSRSLLEACKPGVIVINTSRGAIIDEAALLDGLRSGRVAAAGVDVLDGEPDIDSHPLVEYARHHGNMLITPHCGGFSPDAVRVVCEHAARKILEALTQQP